MNTTHHISDSPANPEYRLSNHHVPPKKLRLKKILFGVLKLMLILYILICVGLYFFQEKLLFFPDKLDKSYKFSFSQPFEEIRIQTGDGNLLDGLLFKAKNAKGLIFYLHGNAGSLEYWGSVAKQYTAFNYDVFILDYPGYGKSSGSIRSEEQLLDEIQTAYNKLKKKYAEHNIVVLGYSLGTGPAAFLASRNHPELLVLEAPYYNLTDMMQRSYPMIPTFLLKYKLATNEYLMRCKMPIAIFHGKQDKVIYYGSSLKLKKEFKRGDTLITLEGQGHNDMTDNPQYMMAIKTILP